MAHGSREKVVWEARWNDIVVAEAAHLTRASGREFFWPAAVRWELLRPAGTRPGPRRWGPATTFDLVVDDRIVHDSARRYRNPAPDLLNIKDLVTFSPNVAVAAVRRPAPIRGPSRWRTALRRHHRAGPPPTGAEI
jgi:uncharacterized protein (DUF427 family)